MRVLCLWAFAGFATAAGENTTDFTFYASHGPCNVTKSTVSTGFLNYAAMWWPSGGLASDALVPGYVFAVGTGAIPEDYAATAVHIASHGIAALLVPMDGTFDSNLNWVTHGLDAVFIGGEGLPDELVGRIDTSKLATGGHSGGGPLAFDGGTNRSDVKAIIGQHAAAIPLMNRPTDEVMGNIQAQTMNICGTLDTTPFCGCSYATDDYFNRVAGPKMLVAVPATHVQGAVGPSGDSFEGGYVVAFLKYALDGDQDARAAIDAGRAPEDQITDEL